MSQPPLNYVQTKAVATSGTLWSLLGIAAVTVLSKYGYKITPELATDSLEKIYGSVQAILLVVAAVGHSQTASAPVQPLSLTGGVKSV